MVEYINVEVAAGQGSTVPSGEVPYSVGSPVTLTAYPAVGYAFEKWEYRNEYGQIVQTWTDNPVTIVFGNGYYFHVYCYFKWAGPMPSFCDANHENVLQESYHGYQIWKCYHSRFNPFVGIVYDVVYYESTHPVDSMRYTVQEVEAWIDTNLVPATSSVTITVTGQGTTDPAPGQHSYSLGSTLYVTATPSAGWHYKKMKRNGVDWTDANPGEFLNLAQVEEIEVVFEENPAPVPGYSNVTISVTGQGTTDPSVGTHQYDLGSTLYVKANPMSGWRYVKMKRNGVDWTTANPGEFLNLAESELIEVMFSRLPTPSPPCPVPSWLKHWPRLYEFLCKYMASW